MLRLVVLHSCLALPFFFYCYGAHRDLHSFPTRRSSDLALPSGGRMSRHGDPRGSRRRPRRYGCALPYPPLARRCAGGRSEEHTSELQSLTNLVCRLLLEKKKDGDGGGSSRAGDDTGDSG